MSGVGQLLMAFGGSARDGAVWQDQSSNVKTNGFPGGTPSSSFITTAAYGTPGFFLHGSNGSAYMGATSPDGLTWTNQAALTTRLEYCIWTGAVYIASFASVTLVKTSPDGITWTNRTLTGFAPPGGGTVKTFASNGSRIVVLGTEGWTAASTDNGVTWTSSNNLASLGSWAFSTFVKYVRWSGTKFLAFGSNREVAQSTDGLTWTATGSLPASFASTSATTFSSNGSRFLAISGGRADTAAYSDNEGTSWTDCGVAMNAALGSGRFAIASCWNGKFFVATDGFALCRSSDAITWSNVSGISGIFSSFITRDCLIWTGANMLAFGGEYSAGIYVGRSV